MSTQIRPELSKNNKYWIPRHRFYELKHFVMQYPEWELKIASIDSMVKSHMDPAGRINDLPGDGVADAVIKRAEFTKKRTMCLSAAKKTDPKLGKYILQGIINGDSYDIVLANTGIPCSKDTYYELYRKFFWILNQLRG